VTVFGTRRICAGEGAKVNGSPSKLSSTIPRQRSPRGTAIRGMVLFASPLLGLNISKTGPK